MSTKNIAASIAAKILEVFFIKIVLSIIFVRYARTLSLRHPKPR
jgi:hypothetical protein